MRSENRIEDIALPYWQEREAHDECGIVGVTSVVGDNLAVQVRNAMTEQQHRGQDAAGLAFYHADKLEVRKGLGLVDSALPTRLIKNLPASIHIAMGHVRYSTVEVKGRKKQLRAAAPIKKQSNGAEIAVEINGHVNNIEELLDGVDRDPDEFVSDTEGLTEVLAVTMGRGASAEDALAEVLPGVNGAFSLMALAEGKLFAARDGHGFRPMALGKRNGDGWAITSESGALGSTDANFVRDVAPGELLIVEGNNLKSKGIINGLPQRTCLMEYLYLARPDTKLDGLEISAVRQDLGRRLAIKAPVDADVVIGIPDSGVPAAIGYARESGIPLAQGFVKNQYVGRTFITRGQMTREEKVRMKLRPIESDVRGKRVVFDDDSIVRGTTTAVMVAMLREAGAREVHGRISSPPYKWPCFYGLATEDRELLIASRHPKIEDIRREIGADSLAYLDLDETLEAVGSLAVKRVCTACFDKDYPTPIDPKLYS
jgi:amidophosphoribosyltransferase